MEASNEIKQRSPEWFESRFGCFTASEFHKLMAGGKRKMTPEELVIEKLNKGKRTTVDTVFGDVAMSYINSKLTDILTNGLNKEFTFKGNMATEYGEIMEPTAREAFTKSTGIKVKECSFIKIADRFGGSPDGLTEDAIIEIKCPWICENHVQNLLMDTEEDFIELHYDYYIQMQVNMIAAGVDHGYFISYDNRMRVKTYWLKYMRIEQNEAIKNEIMFRYKEALKILNQKLEKLYNMIP